MALIYWTIFLVGIITLCLGLISKARGKKEHLENIERSQAAHGSNSDGNSNSENSGDDSNRQAASGDDSDQLNNDGMRGESKGPGTLLQLGLPNFQNQLSCHIRIHSSVKPLRVLIRIEEENMKLYNCGAGFFSPKEARIADSELLTVIPWSNVTSVSSSQYSPAPCKRGPKFYTVILKLKSPIKVFDTGDDAYGVASLSLMNFQGVSHVGALNMISEAYRVASKAPQPGNTAKNENAPNLAEKMLAIPFHVATTMCDAVVITPISWLLKTLEEPITKNYRQSPKEKLLGQSPSDPVRSQSQNEPSQGEDLTEARSSYFDLHFDMSDMEKIGNSVLDGHVSDILRSCFADESKVFENVSFKRGERNFRKEAWYGYPSEESKDTQREMLDSVVAGTNSVLSPQRSKAVLRRVIELDAPVPLFAKFIARKDRTKITKWQQLELVRSSSIDGDRGEIQLSNEDSGTAEIEEEPSHGIDCFYMRESSMAHDVPFGKDFVIEQLYWMRPGPDPKTTEVSIFCSVYFIRDCGLLTGKIFRSSINTQRGITKIWFNAAQSALDSSHRDR